LCYSQVKYSSEDREGPYEDKWPYGKLTENLWGGDTSEKVVCKIEEITSVSFGTTSGWFGSFHKERIYYSDSDYNEIKWVLILHRSTKSITIHRDFSKVPIDY
jgi:hypothetical protein